MKPEWEFYHVGWQNIDRPHKIIEGYWMLPRKKDGHGFDTVLEYLMEYKPDILITLADVGWQGGFLEMVYEAKKRGWSGKWVAYTPIDTHSWEYVWWDKVFQAPDLNVAMAEWGEKAMKEHSVPNVTMIPLGVDIETFKPLENKEILRFNNQIHDKFVLGFVGRNQTRKMLDRLLRGFALFSKDREDVLLLLHTDLLPPEVGWSLPCLLEKFEKEIDPQLEKKTILTKDRLDSNKRQRIQPESMNEFYNMMDVFLYPTGGEGFGLPGIECQAAGTPLLMTAYTTGFELTNYRKERQIPVLKDTHGREVTNIGHNGIENAYPDDIEMANILGKLYNDWKEGKLDEEREKAREFSLKYSWDKISKLWINLFENEL
jgi:glycosyltransferase involved in cell wall biosynthesis